jgi:dipeptidyl aminopeptidase/acylaminoacyl peptidase
MLVWVILPPNFATKSIQHFYIARDHKALTQFYSFRWNFQLMANGYIVVAPNRRGMPGQVE